MYLLRSILRFLAGGWLVLFFLFFLLSIFLEISKYDMWAGVALVGKMLNPFSITNYIVVLFLVSPSLLFYWLAEKLPKRSADDTPFNNRPRQSRIKNASALFALAIMIPVGFIYAGLTWYRELIRPYTWSEPIIEDGKRNGWYLAVERKAGSLIMPWTLIKPFPRALGLVHINSIKERGDLILAPMVWVLREQEDDRVEPSKQVHIFNCSKKRYAVVAENGKLADLFDAQKNPIEKHWRDMQTDLIAYFCKP
jgi:hypothetical protein